MHKTSTPPFADAEMPYPALVGQVVRHWRTNIGMEQGRMAQHMNLSQSAYSRIETGDTSMNVWQLRRCCEGLGVVPSKLLAEVELREKQLERQGISIVAEKRSNPAAALIGIAVLAALLAK